MSTTDPLHDAFEELARRADLDLVPDRLAGIRHKRRATQQRRTAVGAAVAALAVVAGGVAVAGLPGGSDRSGGSVATQVPDATSEAAPVSGLVVTMRVEPRAGEKWGVSFHLGGTALSVRDATTGDPIRGGGPLNTRVLLDGKVVAGTDGGAVECDPEGSPERYDTDFGPFVVETGPGTHQLSVAVDYCGAGGQRLTATDRQGPTFDGTAVVADRARKDLDGDGTPERLVLVDEGDDSALRISGSVNGTVGLQAADPTWISGVSDLDGDGDLDVLVDVRWRSVTAVVVVALDDGVPRLVTSPAEGPRRYNGTVDDRFHGTMLIDGELVSWQGEGDGQAVGPVTGGTWVLEGSRLRLVPFDRPMCGSVQVSPRPC